MSAFKSVDILCNVYLISYRYYDIIPTVFYWGKFHSSIAAIPYLLRLLVAFLARYLVAVLHRDVMALLPGHVVTVGLLVLVVS